jgi:hypothetical protein
MSTLELARLLIRDARSELSADPWISADVDEELAACERRLDEPLRVTLAGTLKSGKSTLLNALVREEIAPTDATECTRVVTWFSRSVRRTNGLLQLDLGSVSADRVEHLEVGWPSSLLDGYTLVDTTGTSSNSYDVSVGAVVDHQRPVDGQVAGGRVEDGGFDKG